jgi:hypothetical protein
MNNAITVKEDNAQAGISANRDFFALFIITALRGLQ